MKKFFFLALILSLTCCLLSAVGYTKVSGYYRKDGTYVRPHYRTLPNNNFYDNWSTKGNVNPFTGEPGTKTQEYSSSVEASSQTQNTSSSVKTSTNTSNSSSTLSNKIQSSSFNILDAHWLIQTLSNKPIGTKTQQLQTNTQLSNQQKIKTSISTNTNITLKLSNVSSMSKSTLILDNPISTKNQEDSATSKKSETVNESDIATNPYLNVLKESNRRTQAQKNITN